MSDRRRSRVLLVIAVGVLVLAGVLAITRPWEPAPLRLVVLSDSLSEGMGEVTALEKTWPHVVGAQVREVRREAPRTGGTWLPASLNGEMFGFTAGEAGAGAWPAVDEVGVPGAMTGGPVSWDVDGFDRGVAYVFSERGGAVFTATTDSGEVTFTSPNAGVHSFEVGGLTDSVTVRGDGAVLGFLGRAGHGSVEVYNLSWAGSTTGDWLWWLEQPGLLPLIEEIDPNVIVLSVGGNDFWDDGDWDRFAAHLRAIHDQVSGVAPHASWVLGTQPVADETSEKDWLDFQQVTVHYARELGAPVIDLADQMPAVAVAPQLYASDRIHLTDAGHAFIADLARPVIYKAWR